MKKKIFLFFTFNTSLFDWSNLGLINREIEIYKKLIEKNYEVTFFTFGSEKDINLSNKIYPIKIVPLFKKKPNSKLITLLMSVFFIIKNIKFFYENKKNTYLKTNQLSSAFLPIILKFFFGYKFILRIGYEPNEFYHFRKDKTLIFKYLFRIYSKISYLFSDKVQVTTENIKRYIHENFSINENKIVIIPNLIQTEKFFHIKKKKITDRFLAVTRFTEQKNIKFMMDFAQRNNMKIDFYGTSEEIKKYKSLNKIYNYRCNFFGKIDNSFLPEIYNKYRYFIMMSHFEGNPKTLLEAMACGLVVITSKVTGIKEVVENNFSGICLDFDKLKEFNVMNCRKTDLLSQNAIKQIKDNNSLKKILNLELKNIYEN